MLALPRNHHVRQLGAGVRVPLRVTTCRAYHALFMQSLLVPAKDTELYHFTDTGKDKQFMIFNGGIFPCNRQTVGMTSSISI